jgi:hypothetical protein
MKDSFFKVALFTLRGALLGVIIVNIFVAHLYSEEQIAYIQKIGEIKEGFNADNGINFFWKITGICCDKDNNLYVADAGWNKIFKFNSKGKYILSFGEEGAGPGEFLGTVRGRNLRITYGNDGNIYVMDCGSWRLSVFTSNGVFIRQFHMRPYTVDTPAVNSKGDIYLLSNRGVRVVDRFDPNLKFMASLLDFKSHFNFPYWKPRSLITRRMASERDVLKLITKNDQLILISNFSLRVFVFDKNNKKLSEFKIDEKVFVEDFLKILKKLKKENKRLEKKTKKASGTTSIFAAPFYAFLDKDDNLCLNYLRSDQVRVIYRYKIDGAFLGTWILPDSSSIVKCSNNQECLFSHLEMNSTKIGIYSISPYVKGEKSHIK